MVIRKAISEDVAIVAGLAIQMWESHTMEELTQEFFQCMNKNDSVVFLSISDGKQLDLYNVDCGMTM